MNKFSFSLIELLIIIATLFVLITLATPSIQKTYQRANTIACQGNLKSLSISEFNFSSDYNNKVFSRKKNSNTRERVYWNGYNSFLSPYIEYENLTCSADPYLSNSPEFLYSRDGVSFGRNAEITNKNLYNHHISSPFQKVLYGDSGHRYSKPIERDIARRNNLSSSNRIAGKSNWNDEGVYPRHNHKNANILFFDAHVEMLDNIDVNSQDSINYKTTNEIYERHWVID